MNDTRYTEKTIADVWDQLEVGMEIETNSGGSTAISDLLIGNIEYIDSERLVLSITGKTYNSCKWDIVKRSGGYIKFQKKMKISNSKYAIVKGETILEYVLSGSDLNEVLERVGADVDIFELKKVKTKFKLQEI